jgi:hypothetical protein
MKMPRSLGKDKNTAYAEQHVWVTVTHMTIASCIRDDSHGQLLIVWSSWTQLTTRPSGLVSSMAHNFALEVEWDESAILSLVVGALDESVTQANR